MYLGSLLEHAQALEDAMREWTATQGMAAEAAGAYFRYQGLLDDTSRAFEVGDIDDGGDGAERCATLA